MASASTERVVRIGTSNLRAVPEWTAMNAFGRCCARQWPAMGLDTAIIARDVREESAGAYMSDHSRNGSLQCQHVKRTVCWDVTFYLFGC